MIFATVIFIQIANCHAQQAVGNCPLTERDVFVYQGVLPFVV